MPSVPELFAQAWHSHQAGDLQRAEQLYREILQVTTSDAQVWYLLGTACQVQGNLAEATSSYQQALRLRPHYAEVHNNLGVVLATEHRLDEAVASFRRALQIHPQYADALSGLGTALRSLGRLHESATTLRQALQVEPNFSEAHYNLGNTLLDQGRLDEAVASLQEALRVQPTNARAYNSLGNAYRDQGRLDEAIASYRQALALQPDNLRAHSNLLYSLHYHPGYDAHEIFAEHQAWAERHAKPLEAAVKPHAVDRSPRRLRIGYVSPDFREHVMGFYFEPVLAAHDRRRFEVLCYADVARPDHVTRHIRDKADVWRSLVGLSDAQAAEQIRRDRVDILVDLAGHTGGNRLLVFARKPAPIQVTHFAYPDTTGLATVDYRITDAHSDPPGLTERYHSEELVRLPEICWCYIPSVSPEVGPLPALQAGHITFGSFNALPKVTAEVIALWSRLLAGLAGSRIAILAGAGCQTDGRVCESFAANGISSERVAFLQRRSRQEYFRLYHQVDACLDPFPYNGCNTSADALWMGVPVITLAGGTYVSRQGVSLLSRLGLHELIATSAKAYVEIAVRLGSDLTKLQRIRAGLRDRMKSSTLANPGRFTHGLEEAYLRMWAKWCDDLVG